ncbi:MAG: hypothetical protein AAGD22_00915 [Verrucomicrobiota bacterium]
MVQDPFYIGNQPPARTLGGAKAKKTKITLLAVALLILLALAVAAFFHFKESPDKATPSERPATIIPTGMREWIPINGEPFIGKIKTIASNGRFALFEDPTGETSMHYIEDFSESDQEEIRNHNAPPGLPDNSPTNDPDPR